MKIILIPLLVFPAACRSNVSTTPVQSAPAVDIVTSSSANSSPAATMIVTDPLPAEKKEELGPLTTEIIILMAVPIGMNTALATSPMAEKHY